MSKRKIMALILMASGSFMALGCSLFGPFRIPLSLNAILNQLNLGNLLGTGGTGG